MAKDYIVVVDQGQNEESYIICIDAKPWRVTYIKNIINLDVIYRIKKMQFNFYTFYVYLLQ